MSVRSLVGRAEGDSWRAVYTHWGGYPACRGHQVWILFHDFLSHMQDEPARAAEEMLTFLMEGEHASGWSAFPETIAEHDASVAHSGEDRPWGTTRVTAGWSETCYYHWRGDTEPMIEGPEDAGETWCEWAYIINPHTVKLMVYFIDGGRWRLVNTPGIGTMIDLLGEEPNWALIEAMR